METVKGLVVAMSCRSVGMTRQSTEDCLVQFSSINQSCPTLCNPMDHSKPGLGVHHQLPKFTLAHICCRNSKCFSNCSHPHLESVGMLTLRALHELTKCQPFNLISYIKWYLNTMKAWQSLILEQEINELFYSEII